MWLDFILRLSGGLECFKFHELWTNRCHRSLICWWWKTEYWSGDDNTEKHHLEDLAVYRSRNFHDWAGLGKCPGSGWTGVTGSDLMLYPSRGRDPLLHCWFRRCGETPARNDLGGNGPDYWSRNFLLLWVECPGKGEECNAVRVTSCGQSLNFTTNFFPSGLLRDARLIVVASQWHVFILPVNLLFNHTI